MNLNIWQVLFLALLQGVTELFPISSLGHTVIIPGLLGWGDLVRDKNFLPLIVALHLGTSIALVIYFWRVWLQVLRSIVKTVKDGEVKTYPLLRSPLHLTILDGLHYTAQHLKPDAPEIDHQRDTGAKMQSNDQR